MISDEYMHQRGKRPVRESRRILLAYYFRLCYKDIICKRYRTCSLTGLTPAGFKKLVSKMDVLTKRPCEERSDVAISIKLEVAAKASAQRLADGIQKYVLDGLCKLL